MRTNKEILVALGAKSADQITLTRAGGASRSETVATESRQVWTAHFGKESLAVTQYESTTLQDEGAKFTTE